MASLESLKQKLKATALASTTVPAPETRALSDEEYKAGFSIFRHSDVQTAYDEFVIPQLSRLLTDARDDLAVLEIGPGPESVLASLLKPARTKITRYAAFEPNELFATELEGRLSSNPREDAVFPSLLSRAEIKRDAFTTDSHAPSSARPDDAFDVILFCHSLYGLKPQHEYIRTAVKMLSAQREGAMVVVFHRGDSMPFGDLVCKQHEVFPQGTLHVPDRDAALTSFASFLAGYTFANDEAARDIHLQWRDVYRAVGGRTAAHPDHLVFSNPEFMTIFTRQALSLPQLEQQVRLIQKVKVKNREAVHRHPASVCRPSSIAEVQQCVMWALHNDVSLTVIGGGHGGQCIWPGVTAIDMNAFNNVHIVPSADTGCIDTLVVVGAGCRSEDIIRSTMAVGLTVPLGSRPSVGAGLWLQGGIGHLARMHGLSCDAIVGAVIVGVAHGEIICLGDVPDDFCPTGSTPSDEGEMLWALKGAGTNFGIVTHVVFKAVPAATFSVRNWILPLSDSADMTSKLERFDKEIAQKLPRARSADAYLYEEHGQMHLGVTMYDTTAKESESSPLIDTSFLGQERASKFVDAFGLFDAEMYMAGMHGGHGEGKTSSFKRCLLLKNVGAANVSSVLARAMNTRPTLKCYFHLLQGGGAIRDVAEQATAFGCRDWDFACVITGVWPRELDGTDTAQEVVQWVYDVAVDLLPTACGVYGADLGPDPRDAVLATKAFGPNRSSLGRLKATADPKNVLAYACPLTHLPFDDTLIVFVTGKHCAGKDFASSVFANALNNHEGMCIKTKVVSISDATKEEYAAATGADFRRLLHDRAYKEQHRTALTAYFQQQIEQNPQLPREHLMRTLYRAAGADVIFVTGMRDEAPVATFSPLLPATKMIEVRIEVGEETRRARGGVELTQSSTEGKSGGGQPDFVFRNDTPGEQRAISFAKRYLLPLVSDDLGRLAHMARPVLDFPRPGVDFRHVLDIVQQPGGLKLCTSLLQEHFAGDWKAVDAIAVCETGGFLFASALAAALDLRMVLIRNQGKLPTPTFAAKKRSSHISSPQMGSTIETTIEMDRHAVSEDESVVVVDDVLASGETLCAMLRLLHAAGVTSGRIRVMVVAEFPAHGGRELLRKEEFPDVQVQSLLTFGGS